MGPAQGIRGAQDTALQLLTEDRGQSRRGRVRAAAREALQGRSPWLRRKAATGQPECPRPLHVAEGSLLPEPQPHRSGLAGWVGGGQSSLRHHSGHTAFTPLTASTWHGKWRWPGGTLHILLGGWWPGVLGCPGTQKCPTVEPPRPHPPSLARKPGGRDASTCGRTQCRQAGSQARGRPGPHWAPYHAASGCA